MKIKKEYIDLFKSHRKDLERGYWKHLNITKNDETHWDDKYRGRVDLSMWRAGEMISLNFEANNYDEYFHIQLFGRICFGWFKYLVPRTYQRTKAYKKIYLESEKEFYFVGAF